MKFRKKAQFAASAMGLKGCFSMCQIAAVFETKPNYLLAATFEQRFVANPVMTSAYWYFRKKRFRTPTCIVLKCNTLTRRHHSTEQCYGLSKMLETDMTQNETGLLKCVMVIIHQECLPFRKIAIQSEYSSGSQVGIAWEIDENIITLCCLYSTGDTHT